MSVSYKAMIATAYPLTIQEYTAVVNDDKFEEYALPTSYWFDEKFYFGKPTLASNEAESKMIEASNPEMIVREVWEQYANWLGVDKETIQPPRSYLICQVN